MEEFYTAETPHTLGNSTTRLTRYRGVSYFKPIQAAKETVPVIDVARRLCGDLRPVGNRHVARCPLPDHEDKTPSFTVYPGTNSWFCYGCVRGGDVVELYRIAHGIPQREAHAAAGHLLLEFGYMPPPKPDSWLRKQKRQQHMRDGIEQVRKNILRRRLFKYLILPFIDEIPNEGERLSELERAWEDLQRVPV